MSAMGASRNVLTQPLDLLHGADIRGVKLTTVERTRTCANPTGEPDPQISDQTEQRSITRETVGVGNE